MSLSFVETSPAFMLAGVYGILGYGTFVKNGRDISWKLPALGSALFWGFTIYTLAQEGLVQVWNNHNHNFWGNQVFFDLLYSTTLFWFALLPRAKAVGMPVLPWFVYVSTTASLGGMNMYARILYLEAKMQQETSISGEPTSGATSTTYGGFSDDKKVSLGRY